MANNSILIPGKNQEEQVPELKLVEYLEKDNFLSEYQTEEEKSVVRENLNIYPKESVYNKLESDTKLDESIKKAFDKYLSTEDPHGILPTVNQMILDVVRNDGSTPFIAPLTGVDPITDFHLTTKRFVTKLIKDHINSDDPHNILSLVEDILEQYVKLADIYFKSLLYTKDEINIQALKYLRGDGTTPFTRALVGADPQIDSHLTTKRYVDKVIYNHLIEVDPHNFISILNNRLSDYAKVSNVYSKSLTYSRTLLDSIIRGLVRDAASEAILDHINSFDPHNILNEVKKLKYVKLDGSIPFKSPLKGVDAVDPLDLVTLSQINALKETLLTNIDNKDCEWITSGPALVTVGNIQENQDLPKTMTLQEVMDAIFYGNGVILLVPEYTNISESCKITTCINGSIAQVEYAELFLDGQLIATFTKENFEERCIISNSNPIFSDTEFTFRVTYINGAIHEDTKVTKCSTPIFIGTLPKWKFANTVTYEYLLELCREDGVNNKFYSEGNNVKEITHKYDFTGRELKHLFVVIPEKYPNLYLMSIPSLLFGIEAFDVINLIPLQIPNVPKDVIYKMYVYRQAISSANLETSFKFEK